VHGIVGFDEAKHNLTPEAEVRANLARSDAAFREELEGERDAVKAAVDSGGGGDEMKARLKGVESSLRAQPRADAPAEDASAAQSVAEAVQSGEVVPSIEATSDGEDGKREGRGGRERPGREEGGVGHGGPHHDGGGARGPDPGADRRAVAVRASGVGRDVGRGP
jgi:hypothetical protein